MYMLGACFVLFRESSTILQQVAPTPYSISACGLPGSTTSTNWVPQISRQGQTATSSQAILAAAGKLVGDII
jgi:hypothetical protein